MQFPFTLLFLAMTTASPPVRDPGDRIDIVRGLLGLHESNRARFTKIAIEFQYLDGRAANVAEAEAGEIRGEATSGVYRSRGDDAIYECTFPDAVILAHTRRLGARRTSTSLNSIRLLTDGKLTLSDVALANDAGQVRHATIILPGSREFYKQVQVPMNVGFPDDSRDGLAFMARAVLQSSSGYELTEVTQDVAVDGARAVRVVIKSSRGTRTMWIDPDRGGIVLRTHDDMPGGTKSDLIHSDLRSVPGFGWFPFRRLLVLGNGIARRTVVTSVRPLRASHAPFRLTFPEPIPIVNIADQLAYSPQKVWDLSRLPVRDSGRAAPIEPIPQDAGPFGVPRRRVRRTHPVFTYALLAAVLLLLGGLGVRKALSRYAARVA